MRKLFYKYLWSLIALFLIGFTNLFANPNQNFEEGSIIKIGLENVGFTSNKQLSNHEFFKSCRPENEKWLFAEVINIEHEEENNEELSTNYKPSSDSFITYFSYAQQIGCLSSKLQKDIQRFEPYFIAKPYKRHIRFQVFII